MEFLKKELASFINYGLTEFDNNFESTLTNLETGKILTLTPYQAFTASYFLLEQNPSLLLFWETGFGKTIMCIYLMKNIFKLYPKWKIFIFVKSSLAQDPWRKNIDLFLDEEIKRNVHLIFYDLDITGPFKLIHNNIQQDERVFYIFDESHDFIKKLLPKDNNKPRRLFDVYQILLQGVAKKTNKTLFMTATPMTDSFLEFTYMVNMLRKGTISAHELIFDNKNRLNNPGSLKQVIIGLASFQRFSAPNLFEDRDYKDRLAGKKIHLHNLLMSSKQSKNYYQSEKRENESLAKNFRMARRIAATLAIQETQNIKKGLKDFITLLSDIDFSDRFLQKFASGRLQTDNFLLSQNLNLDPNIDIDFTPSQMPGKPNRLTKDIQDLLFLNTLSCKYVKTCQLIKQSRGKCLVYQPFVTFAGVKTLKIFFDKFKISYIEYTQTTKKIRDDEVERFNRPNNKYGEEVKVCIFSGAGKEGISFSNISDMVIMDIPWSGSNLEQIIGRGIRLGLHEELPEEQRYVNVHILLSHTNDDDMARTIKTKSVDQEILDIVIRKEIQKQEIIRLFDQTCIETIHKEFPAEIGREPTDFEILTNNAYVPQTLVTLQKKLVMISYTFSPDFNIVYKNGYMDKETGTVYDETRKEIGVIVMENSQYVIKIVDNQLVYLISST
ncbi:putative nucleoside triphosphatase I [Diachasmimorpha longicaudata entomopoxvirus]|uniref:Putative nucleoside triphosphatase I n=1 Tax=Diachasmimorpha longicaudata entomopoxvirus TaxID=109981 RepID=A0A7R5WD16_9POXV|nr:putative nucleoside triphosphatase I [Diachasmimorpha longicaudata entomopoxvirus]AKS26372.1 putative nucleoside triphosphatase I [Diachasmimorpha longicaudata entomopoxvirus]